MIDLWIEVVDINVMNLFFFVVFYFVIMIYCFGLFIEEVILWMEEFDEI